MPVNSVPLTTHLLNKINVMRVLTMLKPMGDTEYLQPKKPMPRLFKLGR